MKNSARGDSSTGSELKVVEEACRGASRTVEPCALLCLCGNRVFPLWLRLCRLGSSWSNLRQKSLRRLHLLRVLAAPGGAVALGSMIENLLRTRDVGGLAFPRLKHRILQRAGIRETHLPGMRAYGVHGIEMFRGPLRALAAG